MDPAHRKHRWMVRYVLLATGRTVSAEMPSVQLVVPTAVRVESAWDRRKPTAAPINRLRFADAALDSSAADRAAAVRTMLKLSVADAHIAAVLEDTKGPHAVVTSDREDIGRIAAHLDIKLSIISV